MPQTILPAERTIRRIVVHCSATPSCRWLGGRPGAAARATWIIDAWHKARGFARDKAAVQAFNPHLPHIGYHYVVDLDGRINSGRHLREVGAHTAGHNADSIGICLVGGAEPVASYTQAQWAALAQLVRALDSQATWPLHVTGHRDLSLDADHDGNVSPQEWLKTCPGFDVGAWLREGMRPPPGQVGAMLEAA